VRTALAVATNSALTFGGAAIAATHNGVFHDASFKSGGVRGIETTLDYRGVYGVSAKTEVTNFIMTTPLFFPSAPAFRDWLTLHAPTATELLVGYHKVHTKQASMSWSDSVDEALCFGWIDGVRKRISDDAYQIRFTPRKPSSIWSAVNIAKFNTLQAQGRMTSAGAAAFAHRKQEKSAIYAYEQATVAALSAQELGQFKREKSAWAYFENCPPGYRKQMLHRVVSAKRAPTRAERLSKLVDACKLGIRLQ
jgi:uncharacterized protein YdeI (YjbR/CyaY-like superfamily)